MITSAGVLSGVDGALRVVERMVGQTAAQQAAEAVAWPDYSPGGAAPIAPLRPALPDAVGLLSAGYRWDRPNMAVLLVNGIGEIELASAFRPYTVWSYLVRPVSVTVDGQPIRSRHGLTFVPRANLTSAVTELDRLVVPGADAAKDAVADGLSLPERLPPVYLHTEPGFAFDAALRDTAVPGTSPLLNGRPRPCSIRLRIRSSPDRLGLGASPCGRS
jgi:hypothetical protein